MTLLDDVKTLEQEQPADVNYFEELVGDGKKFATAEEAVQALGKKATHADTFIETLKKEKSEEQRKAEELAARVKTTEEILEAINAKSFEDKPEELSQDTPDTPLTLEDVDKLVQEGLKKSDAEREAAVKKEESWRILAEELGGKEEAKTAVLSFIEKNPDNEAVVNTLGMTDPKAFATLLKKTAVKTSALGEEGVPGRHAEAVRPTLTWSEAKKIKREDPVRYSSLGFQKKLSEAVSFDPDFYKK